MSIFKEKRPSVSAHGRSIAVGGDLTDSSVTIGLDESEVGNIISEKIDPIHSRLSEILKIVAEAKGVEVAPLQAVLDKIGEHNVPPAEIPERLSKAADKLLLLQEQIRKIPADIPELAEIRNESLSLITNGFLSEAAEALSKGREIFRGLRHTHSRNEANLLVDEANLNHLQFMFIEGVSKLKEAAELFSSFDKEAQFNCLFSAVEMLQDAFIVSGRSSSLIEALSIIDIMDSLIKNDPKSIHNATTKAKKGQIFRSLNKFETDNISIHRSIDQFVGALKIAHLNKHIYAFGSLHIELGTSLNVLSEREIEGTSALRAVEAFKVAQEVFDFDNHPKDWILVQDGLGNSLLNLSRRDLNIKHAKDAVECFRTALSVIRTHSIEERYGLSQNNLANALLALGETINIKTKTNARNEKIISLFRESIELYRNSCKLYLDGKQTLNYASSLFGLGNALTSISRLDNPKLYLEEAVEVLKSCSKIFHQGEMLYDLGQSNNSLGIAHLLLGNFNKNEEYISESIAIFEDALKCIDVNLSPLDWAMILGNQGTAFKDLFLLKEDFSYLERAEKQLLHAIEICKSYHLTRSSAFVDILVDVHILKSLYDEAGNKKD